MGAEIGILRMPMGNLQSAWNAVYELGFDPVFLDADGDFDSVSHLIVPGDGNFRAVMQHLESSGATTAIREFAASGRPVLGICSGMQVLADKGLESGGTPGLGLVPGTVQIMTPEGNLRLPHIGWNSAEVRIDHPVFEGLKPNRDFYYCSRLCICTGQSRSLSCRNRLWRLFREYCWQWQCCRFPVSSGKEPDQRIEAHRKFSKLGWIMLKKRIIPVQLLLDGRLVKPVKFGGISRRW